MEQLIKYIREAKHILIFTGAGISTGSGIPDFRGPQGIWKKRQPVYYQDFMISEEARIEYWDYKLEGWEAFKNAQPNQVHHAIVKLEQSGKLDMLITQNIDGLHRRAGTSLELLVELHGNNDQVECQRCLQISDPAVHFEFFKKTGNAPKCQCGGLLKIATISFGQNLCQEDLDRASQAALRADLVIALGSTLSVNPAASICLLAADRGIPYIIINRGETDHDHHPQLALRLEGDVSELFPPTIHKSLS